MPRDDAADQRPAGAQAEPEVGMAMPISETSDDETSEDATPEGETPPGAGAADDAAAYPYEEEDLYR